MTKRWLLPVLLLALALPAAAQEQRIREALEPKLGVKVEGVSPSPLPGIYEVRLQTADGPKIIYSDDKGNLLFPGFLVDLADRTPEGGFRRTIIKTEDPDRYGIRVGDFEVLRCVSPAVPNAIAALLLLIRDRTGQVPHAYFGWTEGNPITYLLKFLAFGEGDTAPVTREVLRQAEPDPARRPRIHVG